MFLSREEAIGLPAAGTLRFVVAGDTGARGRRLRPGILAVQRDQPLHGIILAGDNFYPCGVFSVEDPQWKPIVEDHFSVLNLPIYPVLGNHDYGQPEPRRGGKVTRTCGDADPGAQIEATGRIKNWIFPARNYVMRGPFVDIFMVDTQPLSTGLTSSFLGSATMDESIKWLAGVLKESDARWKIVVGHHPLYSSGHYGSAHNSEQSRLRELIPLFREHNVAMYVSGHDHHLELLGEVPRKKDPIFLVSGAGAGVRPFVRRKRAAVPPAIFPPAGTQPFLGFAVLEISADFLAVTFYSHIGIKRSDRIVAERSPDR